MSCRWVVDIDGVGAEVRSDRGWGVHVRSDLARIQRGVMLFADGGGCWVDGRGLCSLSFAGKVLSKGETGSIA